MLFLTVWLVWFVCTLFRPLPRLTLLSVLPPLIPWICSSVLESCRSSTLQLSCFCLCCLNFFSHITVAAAPLDCGQLTLESKASRFSFYLKLFAPCWLCSYHIHWLVLSIHVQTQVHIQPCLFLFINHLATFSSYRIHNEYMSFKGIMLCKYL